LAQRSEINGGQFHSTTVLVITTGRAQSAMSDVQHPADPRWFYIGANW
jgi:hypothetical protein